MFSILLVEDEKLELETLRDYVDWKKLWASKVYTARNGRTALECLEEHDPDSWLSREYRRTRRRICLVVGLANG